MALVKVEGTNFYRDTKTLALINSDSAGREDYLTKKKLLSNQKEEINKVRSEINEIKSDLSDIKSLMLKILEKGQNG
jgi:hypothetical protein